MYDELTDAQFGFKPGCGTTDAIFALYTIIINTIMSKKKLYACFVDYSKAFDTIVHDKLWLKLIRSGVNELFCSLFVDLCFSSVAIYSFKCHYVIM